MIGSVCSVQPGTHVSQLFRHLQRGPMQQVAAATVTRDNQIGRVDAVEGNRIKLTKADSGEGSHKGHHHYIDLGLVAEVEGRRSGSRRMPPSR